LMNSEQPIWRPYGTTAASAMEGWASSRASSSAGGTCTGRLRNAEGVGNSWLSGLAAYLEALELDELLDAVDDEDLLVVVDVADVAGVEPAVDVDRPRGGLRVVQVPCAGTGRSLVAHGGAPKLC